MNKQEILTILNSKNEELIETFITTSPAFQLETLIINKQRIEEYEKNKQMLIDEWNNLVSVYYTLQNYAEKIGTNVSDLKIDEYDLEREIEIIDDQVIENYKTFIEYLIRVRRGEVFTFSLEKSFRVDSFNLKRIRCLSISDSEKMFNTAPEYVTGFETIDHLLKHVNGLSIPSDTSVYINNILLDDSKYKLNDNIITINEKSVKSVILNKKSNKQLVIA